MKTEILSFDPLEVDALSWTLASVSAHADLVKRGVRPAAAVIVHNEFLTEAKAIPYRMGIMFFMVLHEDTHTELYLFKHAYLRRVIRALLRLQSNEDDRVLSIWGWGKLFGYSDSAIGKFYKENLPCWLQYKS